MNFKLSAVVCALLSMVVTGQDKYYPPSKQITITSKKDDYTMTMKYSSQLTGEDAPALVGQIDIETTWNENWDDGRDIRICMEIDSEKKVRNERVIRNIFFGEIKGGKLANDKWEEGIVRNDKKGENAGSWNWFCRIKRDYGELNKTAKSGFSKVGGSINAADKKAILTFTRPFTYEGNEDLNIESGKSYGLVMTWSRQNNRND